MGDLKGTPEQVIYVCTGDKCKKRGGKQIARFYKDHIKQSGSKGKIEIIKTDCTDRCKYGPIVCFQPQNEWHMHVQENEADALLKKAMDKL